MEDVKRSENDIHSIYGDVGLWYMRSCSLCASIGQSKRYTLKLGAEFISRAHAHTRQRRKKFEFQMQRLRNEQKEKHAREDMKNTIARTGSDDEHRVRKKTKQLEEKKLVLANMARHGCVS